MTEQGGELKRTLGPLMLWALGVGYVISGMYFGWNLGLPHGGTYGLLGATLLVTVLYVTFVLSYAELACALPRAGGAFVYASRAFGPGLGFLAGEAQFVEFVFAMPAIAVAIGAYFQSFLPGVDPRVFAAAAYLLFTGLNIFGVKQSAAFELAVTVLAVAELLVFAGVTAPRFSWEAFAADPLPRGWWGVFPAIPFAIWFYVCIEGIANVAEESVNPRKDIPLGFGTAMGTLVVLALLTFFCAVGVAGWKPIATSDKPLPVALGQVVGESHPLFHLLIVVGVCGLVASFHGIMLAGGRATFELGRAGYAPRILGRTLPVRKTPAAALVFNSLVGFAAILTGKTDEIITMAIFGALTLYVLSMIALFRLRKKEPELDRPFRAPLFPWTPAAALVLSLVSLAAMTYHNWKIALAYVGILALGYAWFAVAVRVRKSGETAHG